MFKHDSNIYELRTNLLGRENAITKCMVSVLGGLLSVLKVR